MVRHCLAPDSLQEKATASPFTFIGWRRDVLVPLHRVCNQGEGFSTAARVECSAPISQHIFGLVESALMLRCVQSIDRDHTDTSARFSSARAVVRNSGVGVSWTKVGAGGVVAAVEMGRKGFAVIWAGAATAAPAP